MLRQLIEYLGRKKNPGFKLPPEAGTAALISFALPRFCGLLRSLRLLFHGIRPQWMMLGRGVRIRGGRHLRIGRMVQVHDHAELHAWGSGGLSIGDYASIGAYSKLFVSYSINDPGKHIRIGKHVGIGDHAHLGGAGGLDIGDECIIGPFLSCHPENHRYENPDLPIRLQGVTRKGIRIGRNCWIGAKVTILDGVEIGDNCIIAAGAVVNRSLPAGSIAGGVPAKVIRSLYPEVHASALQA